MGEIIGCTSPKLIKDKTGKFVTQPTIAENDTFIKILNIFLRSFQIY